MTCKAPDCWLCDNCVEMRDVISEIAEAVWQARCPDDGSEMGDFFHDTWNPDAHVEITLTIADIRRILTLGKSADNWFSKRDMLR